MFDLDLFGAPAFAVSHHAGEFRFTATNRALTALSGLPAEHYIGRTPVEILGAHLGGAIETRYAACLAARQVIIYEEEGDFAAGPVFWQTTLTPIFQPDTGRIESLLGVSVDVTDTKKAERAASAANARLSLAMAVLQGGFWHYDIARSEFQTSAELAALMEGPGCAPMGLADYMSHILEEDHGKADLSAYIRGDQLDGVAEYRVRTHKGDLRWIQCRRRVMTDGDGRPVDIVGVAVDVTDQKRTEQDLVMRAETDALTGLSNRRGFDARVERLIGEIRPGSASFGLILIDLDRFKAINDRFGHNVGDKALRESALRLKGQIRPTDLVARLGGDEFVVLIEDADEQTIRRAAARIATALDHPILTDEGPVEVTASVGATLSIPTDRRPDDVVLRADRALYDVKLSGRASWRVAA